MKQSIYPLPVYEAHFADGTIGRCSFWSPAGKPIDFEHGRRVAAILWARPEIPDKPHGAHSWRSNPLAASFFQTYEPREIVTGFVEHDTIGRIEDTPEMRSALAKPRKPSAKIVALAAIKALENGDLEALRSELAKLAA